MKTGLNWRTEPKDIEVQKNDKTVCQLDISQRWASSVRMCDKNRRENVAFCIKRLCAIAFLYDCFV